MKPSTDHFDIYKAKVIDKIKKDHSLNLNYLKSIAVLDTDHRKFELEQFREIYE